MLLSALLIPCGVETTAVASAPPKLGLLSSPFSVGVSKNGRPKKASVIQSAPSLVSCKPLSSPFLRNPLTPFPLVG